MPPLAPSAAWRRSSLGLAVAVFGLAAHVTAQAGAPAFPARIPIFPLPDATLFPSSTQPFHIFEPRYREMVADALAGDSIIGMATLRPGFEADYDGRPPVYEVGCAGLIVAAERLPDGRYNLVLRALGKFRIVGEDSGRAYRLARVEGVAEPSPQDERELLVQRRRQLESAVLARYPRAELPPGSAPDAVAIDQISLAVPLEPAARQRLLEANGPLERASLLVGMLRGGASV